MGRFRLALLLAWSAAAFSGISPEAYKKDVDFLASPAMKGRGDGSPELDKAARFIAHQFGSAHLKKLNGSYYQDFTLTAHARLGSHNHLEYSVAGKRTALKLRDDYLPFSFSGNGFISGQIVFAGYGITAPEYQYDDYAGLDVKDKIVLVLRHEPAEATDGAFFAGRELTIHSQFFSKATNAKQHGALGIMLVSDIANHVNDGDSLERFSAAPGPNDSGIPYLQLSVSAADALLASSHKTVRELQTGIDSSRKPASFALAQPNEVSAKIDITRERRRVHNVLGYLPGSTSEYIVIGAHYDHLGLGEQFSLAPTQVGSVHPGADDNASGTAGVIELARRLSNGHAMKRGVLFLAFAGEELGLLGSSYYVNHPELPLSQAVAMINMDMIGRIKDNKVYVGGIATGTTFRPLLDEAAKGSPFHLDMTQQALNGSSDHTSFLSKQIPSLFLFSGLHGDYHKPSDTPSKINSEAATQLLDVVASLVAGLDSAEVRPKFVRQSAETSSNPHEGAAPSSGSGYGPYFGSIPDFAEVPQGVRFADVTAGSPAGKAGFKAGDIMVEFDGKAIQNLYDFTYSLRAHKPGDQVNVKVMRDGKPVEAVVTLAVRK